MVSMKGAPAVLLIQLGTPDAPTTPAVRRYLREFLSDPRIIEAPRLTWWFILNLLHPAAAAGPVGGQVSPHLECSKPARRSSA